MLSTKITFSILNNSLNYGSKYDNYLLENNIWSNDILVNYGGPICVLYDTNKHTHKDTNTLTQQGVFYLYINKIK